MHHFKQQFTFTRLHTFQLKQYLNQKIHYQFNSPNLIKHKIQILCFGAEQVGKTTFLKKYNRQIDKNQSQQCCDVYIKLISSLKSKQLYGVEFYDFPSHHNLDYHKCYLGSVDYQGLIFFYDMKIKKSKNRLYKILHKIYECKPQKLWKLPILIIGLKKNKIKIIQQQIKQSKQYFENIINTQNILFVGNELQNEQQQKLESFVRKVMDKQNFRIQKCYLIRSLKAFYYIFNNEQLLGLVYQYMRDIGQNIYKRIKIDKKE